MLHNSPRLPAGDIEGVEDLWESLVELDVDDGADDGQHLALVLLAGGLRSVLLQPCKKFEDIVSVFST